MSNAEMKRCLDNENCTGLGWHSVMIKGGASQLPCPLAVDEDEPPARWELNVDKLKSIESHACGRCCPEVGILATSVRMCDEAYREARARVADLERQMSTHDGIGCSETKQKLRARVAELETAPLNLSALAALKAVAVAALALEDGASGWDHDGYGSCRWCGSGRQPHKDDCEFVAFHAALSAYEASVRP